MGVRSHCLAEGILFSWYCFLSSSDWFSQLNLLLPWMRSGVCLLFGYSYLPPATSHWCHYLPLLQVSAWRYGNAAKARLYQLQPPCNLPPPNLSAHPPHTLLKRPNISKNCLVTWGPMGRRLLVANVQINTYSCLSVCRENQVWLLITALGGENKRKCAKSRPLCRRKMSSSGCSILTFEGQELERSLGPKEAVSCSERCTVFRPCLHTLGIRVLGQSHTSLSAIWV